MIFILYALNRRPFKWQFTEIVFSLFWTIILFCITIKVCNKYACLLVYISVFMYYRKRFNEKNLEIFIKSTLALGILGGIELMLMLCLNYLLFILKIQLSKEQGTLMFFILSIGVCVFSFFFDAFMLSVEKKTDVFFVFREKKSQIVIVTTITFLIVSIKLSFVNKYILGLLFLLIMIIYVLRTKEILQAEKIKSEYEKDKLTLIYSNAYEELIKVVRRNQHDYKNQLEVIKGMWLLDDLPEANVENQKQYMEELSEKYKSDSILTGCNNSILAGYLYSKVEEWKKQGIRVRLHIKVDQANCCLKLHEILEILGVLLNNAKECVSLLSQESPTISVSITESCDKLCVSIKNVSEYKSYRDIENMFHMGVSTKGENRGIGLYSVKELLNKNNIDIKVENINDGEDDNEKVNWLSFSFEIPKCNKATHY